MLERYNTDVITYSKTEGKLMTVVFLHLLLGKNFIISAVRCIYIQK